MNALSPAECSSAPTTSQRNRKAQDRSERIALLSSCLALVKPAGMSESDVRDWISVAARALEYLPVDLVERGCRAAYLRCTHHSQIVPVIESETRDELAWRNRPVARSPKFLPPPVFDVEPAEPRELPAPSTLNTALIRMGLSRGWIVEGLDGQLEWSPEDEKAT